MKIYSLEALIEATDRGIVKWMHDEQLSKGGSKSLTTFVNRHLVTLTRNGRSHNVTLESNPTISVGVIDNTPKTKGDTLLDNLWTAACKSAGLELN